MAILTVEGVKRYARAQYARRYATKTAGKILTENRAAVTPQNRFDIFLSHSYQDAAMDNEALLGLHAYLSSHLDLVVYVDWINDAELDRKSVTARTAALLRARMQQSDCLFFATSDNSSTSRWMPWELGYFDGIKSKVAILPLTGGDTYEGQEYLGLYPFVDFLDGTMFINSPTDGNWVEYEEWIDGSDP